MMASWSIAIDGESFVSGLQLATGKAENEIPPDTSLYLEPKFVSQYTTEMATTKTTKAARGALDLREEDAAQALIDLLGQLGSDEGEIEALNKALRDLRAPVSVRLKPDNR